MSTISTNKVKHIASLAAIAITDKEVVALQKELDSILAYVRQLDNLDTQGVEPTYQVTGLQNVMREDEIINYGLTQAELFKNARAVQEGQLKVPKVL